ncbi:TRAP transporter small permease subunit [Roseovarius pelagicus]|uniref:TRAP transporter small permease protein n=1 Tax=Roseovarius pelagicus TaxID=2980108 RepID=A0ABY6DDR6_9RHOB|nr:TRAP transporter small permease subunit [Roseovarius pelagicus]UXX84302.1 TRAP transporter small permease subunit [Roseovarius pelagicus]
MPAGTGMKSLGDTMLNALAVLVIALMLCVVLQVACSFFDINPLISFENRVGFFGKGITLNSLLDLQWHLFALICLVPSGAVLIRDTHVRVDFLYDRLGPNARRGIDGVGHVVFALPFFVMALPAAWDFAMRAYRSGEGSRNGGLDDLWIIKLVLPVGLGLLAVAIVWETGRLIRGNRAT